MAIVINKPIPKGETAKSTNRSGKVPIVKSMNCAISMTKNIVKNFLLLRYSKDEEVTSALALSFNYRMYEWLLLRIQS